MADRRPFLDPASLRVIQKAFEGLGAEQFEQLRKATQVSWVDHVGRLGDSVQLDALAAKIDRGLGLDQATMDRLAEALRRHSADPEARVAGQQGARGRTSAAQR